MLKIPKSGPSQTVPAGPPEPPLYNKHVQYLCLGYQLVIVMSSCHYENHEQGVEGDIL